jgi:hypothetical protein
MSFNMRLHVWLQRDAAPPQRSREARPRLFEIYAGRWIGRGPEAAFSCPACSPGYKSSRFLFFSPPLGMFENQGYVNTFDKVK